MTRTQNRQVRAKLLAQQRRDASAALVAADACERGSPEHLAALERCAEVLRSNLFVAATERQLKQLAKEFPELQQQLPTGETGQPDSSAESKRPGGIGHPAASTPPLERQPKASAPELPWRRQPSPPNSSRRSSE
jgi:hypothetical protein